MRVGAAPCCCLAAAGSWRRWKTSGGSRKLWLQVAFLQANGVFCCWPGWVKGGLRGAAAPSPISPARGAPTQALVVAEADACGVKVT